jgi:hypothetical protein
VGRSRHPQPVFRVADEPEGPPELRAISFRPLADGGERLGVGAAPAGAAAVSAPAPSAPGAVAPAPLAAPAGLDAGEDPAALAFAFARHAATALPQPPRLAPGRPAATAALLVAVAAAAFAAGRGAGRPPAVPERAAPPAAPSRQADGAHHGRSRPARLRSTRSRGRRSTRVARPRGRRGSVTRSRAPVGGATRLAPRVVASAATAPAAASVRAGHAPADEFGFEGRQ